MEDGEEVNQNPTSEHVFSQLPEPDGAAVDEREGGAEDDREVAGARRYACEFCLKVFSSGKALGGHKRIHSEDKRDHGMKKSGTKKKRSRFSTANGSSGSFGLKRKVEREPITTCPICKSEFHSEKAMSGHLKVHKDRPWKGLRPPVSYNDVNSSHSLNLNPRYRRSLIMNYGDSSELVTASSTEENTDLEEYKEEEEDGEDEEDEEIVELASVLMMLGSGARPSSGLISPQLEKDADSPNQPRLENVEAPSKKDSEHLEKVDVKKKKKRKLLGRHKDEGGDTDSSRVETAVYTCGPCEKVFTSHHAYGGHLSSHNKTKKTSSTSSLQQTLGPAAEPATAEKRAAPPPHVLNFDLNHPAPEMDQQEEVEIEGKNGIAPKPNETASFSQ